MVHASGCHIEVPTVVFSILLHLHLQELIEFFNGAILAVTGNAVHQAIAIPCIDDRGRDLVRRENGYFLDRLATKRQLAAESLWVYLVCLGRSNP